MALNPQENVNPNKPSSKLDNNFSKISRVGFDDLEYSKLPG